MTGAAAARPAGLRRLLELGGPFLGLLLVVVLFSVLVPESFLSLYNIKNVLTQTVIVALGAIGMTFVIMSGGIDLSVGSVIALASVVTAILLREHYPPSIAFLGGIVTGTVIGALNGGLVTGLRVVPFIVTLGTLSVARGVAKWIAEEQKVDVPEATWLSSLMVKTPEPRWLLIGPGVWITVALAALMALVLARTVFGTHAVAIGSNEQTARLCGVRVERTKLAIYTLCGVFAGLAGVMQFGRLNVGDPTVAIGLELDIIAAVVIGGGSLSGGSGSILGAMVGALFMAVLANGCALMGVPNYVQQILVGAIIVAAAALDRLRRSATAA
jgi:ribose transport system permease protein